MSGKIYKAKKINIPKVERSMQQAMDTTSAKISKTDFADTVGSWENGKPLFKPVTKIGGRGIISRVYVRENPGAPAEPHIENGVTVFRNLSFWKWYWINFGTSKSFAVFSSDWKSKRNRGQIKSGGGSGRLIGIRRRPGKGQEAQNWRKLIRDKHLKLKSYTKAVNRALKRINIRS